MGINDIINEVLALKPKERYLIMDTIMSSFSKTKEDLSHLGAEVEKGINAKLSRQSHKEIFQNLKSKYA